MKEYIEKAAIIDLITRRYEQPELCTYEINSIPAADVAPVRHGRWIELSRASKCSECGFETGRYEPPRRYCPECGARMDGEETATCHDGVCDIPGINRKEADHEIL